MNILKGDFNYAEGEFWLRDKYHWSQKTKQIIQDKERKKKNQSQDKTQGNTKKKVQEIKSNSGLPQLHSE